ncbi:MAG: hypothetical protein CME75_09660 [Halomonas sp.]|nr:hypothetical protein [Halomonas sp.]|tara:strand:- start:1572 stop:2015 length:444 start_codon:yes stop_codon:yes gene_type:complete
MTSLISEVKPKIEDAIKNLDKVEVPEEERDELAEVVASKTSTFYGEYIQKWKSVEREIYELLKAIGPEDNELRRHRPVMMQLKPLIDAGIIDKAVFHELREANHVRNIIVHESDRHFSNDELLYRIENLDKIIDYLSELEVTVGNDS